jgi:hypothetical protein
MMSTDFQLVSPIPDRCASAEERIHNLSIGEKVKLAYRGSQEDRRVLIRDPNQIVSSAVVKSGRLTPPEVITYARNPHMSGAVVREIARNKAMLRTYPVKVALVKNPKTPLSVAIRLLPQLQRRDLQALTNSRAVSAAIMKAARQTYRQRYLH